MDDKRVEQLLRESWNPDPPDGMRERVLDKASRQASRRWTLREHSRQAATVAASLLVVLLTGLSDRARQARLASMSDGIQTTHTQLAACPQTLGWLRLEVDRALDSLPAHHASRME